MTRTRDDFITQHFRQSREALERVAGDRQWLATVAAIADTIACALRAGGKLMIAGNGGSAADAQHIAGEFLSRLNFDRHPLPAIALTTDTSVLTAVGNDYGFEHIFARQIRGLGKAGDVFIAISTSGRSANVLAALRAAREIGIRTIGMTGNGETAMPALCDLCLAVPAIATQHIQEVHIIAAHAICGQVERELCGAADK